MIGVGIFTTTGFLAGDLGSPNLVLWIWVVGAVAAFLGAISYAELSINFPKSGGEYIYLTKAYGPTWGFMTGWVSFFAGFSAPIAAVSLAFSDYLGYFFPAVRVSNAQFAIGSGEWVFHVGGAQLVAALVVTAFTILNVLGVKRVANVQNLLTMLKITVLLGFIVLAFTVGEGSMANFGIDAERTSTNSVPAQFAVSLFWIYLAYSGWNAATYVAEEIRNPGRTLPLALGVGAVLVMVMYLALNVVFIYAAPLETLKGQVAVGSIAAEHLFGTQVSSIFSALMALSLLATINAMVTVGPRVYYAMARDGAFLRQAAQLHPKFETPAFAVIAQGVCTLFMTMTPFPDLVVYAGFTLNLFAAMAVGSIFLFRARQPEWKKLRVVSFLYPLVPGLFVTVALWMTIYGVMLRPMISLAAGLTVATGAVVYRSRFQGNPDREAAMQTQS